MKNLVTKTAALVAAFTISASVSALLAGGHEHDGNDHGDHKHDDQTCKGCNGHDHCSESATADSLSLLRHLGLKYNIVEDRFIGGEEVTAVPIESVFFEGKSAFVVAFNDGRLARWEVTPGKSDGRFVEAKTGVFPGDKIVSAKRRNRSMQQQACQRCVPRNGCGEGCSASGCSQCLQQF